MPKLQPIRGMKDVYGEEAVRYQWIIDQAKQLADVYNFQPFFTPIAEFTEVYKRTLGELSDVVNKEMYTFLDRNEESLTLRPEFTAGVARAFISSGLQQKLPVKAFSYGPLFRYERPQKGRQRQFTQVNFEWLGAKGATEEAELIALAHALLNAWDVPNVTLELNTLGNAESRAAYLNALVNYLNEHKAQLSEDSLQRLTHNPLRILDSKDKGDKELVKNAPTIQEYLTDSDKAEWQALLSMLDELQIEYVINPYIVRGLDYYNGMVFEFISHDKEAGAQNTVLAGGRYDALVSTMGGPETPAIGFAAGVERIALLSKGQPAKTSSLAVINDEGVDAAAVLSLANSIRKTGIRTECFTSGNFNKRMKKISNKEFTVVGIVRADGVEYKGEGDDAERLKAQIKEVIL